MFQNHMVMAQCFVKIFANFQMTKCLISAAEMVFVIPAM